MKRKQSTLLVSIDGVAPRHISATTMPNLCGLARQGASCFNAKTVTPSVTVPAHASLIRGVVPKTHGLFDNSLLDHPIEAPSIFKVARDSGLSTASFVNWRPIDVLMEANAVQHRFVIDGGYEAEEDDRVVAAACGHLNNTVGGLTFVYIAHTDVQAHATGWDSKEYVEALNKADQLLGLLLKCISAEDSVLVTTDHGGLGKNHEAGRPEDMRTFVCLRSPGILPASTWEHASIIDVAPTIAQILSIQPNSLWEGQALVGQEQDLTEKLMQVLASTEAYSYGERVNMLQHSLQTAAVAQTEGAPDSLVLAALLHDVGHLMGDAGEWGLPGHAEVGAAALQQILPRWVTEPVRLHVDAKRYLVATDSEYTDRLSHASVMTLAEQGGPYDEDSCRRFEEEPFWQAAVQLRKFDDAGKIEGLDIPPLSSYKEMLRSFLTMREPSPQGIRNACVCRECRDPGNGQHLLTAADLAGWCVKSSDTGGTKFLLERSDGEQHLCLIDETARQSNRVETWDARMQKQFARNACTLSQTNQAVSDLVKYGIVLIKEVPITEGQVLEVAEKFGFVRETNYGRLFDVIAEPDPINLAYTPVGLPLHTDNPYRDPCPTVQLLHCLEASSEGGASQFSDGFRAAEVLRVQHPELFRLLTEVTLEFRFSDTDVDLRAFRPMIALDQTGAIASVAVNNRAMTALDRDHPDCEAFYVAYRKFTDLLSHEEAILNLVLQPGDLVAFDNRRVLHGRSAFTLTSKRHLQGCYIDVDAIESHARMTQV